MAVIDNDNDDDDDDDQEILFCKTDLINMTYNVSFRGGDRSDPKPLWIYLDRERKEGRLSFGPQRGRKGAG